MTIILDRDQGLLLENDEQLGLECPYCSVYSHMSPESVPQADDLLQHRPNSPAFQGHMPSYKAPRNSLA